MTTARDAALRNEQAVLAHDALHALAVDEPARGAAGAEPATDHRRRPPGAEPGSIAADIEHVGLDEQVVGQRRPTVRPRPPHHVPAGLNRLDGLDGLDGLNRLTRLDGGAMVERLAADAEQASDRGLGVLLVILGGQGAPDPGARSQPNRLDASPKISSSSVLRPSARSSSRIRASAA